MESHIEESATKFLQAQTQVWNHISNFINSMSQFTLAYHISYTTMDQLM